jgi:hypothetical protein
MSRNLQVEAEQLVRLKLKLGINRYLSAGRGERYLVAVANNFSTTASKEIFDSVVGEMEREGLLRKVIGRQGGVILARCEASTASCTACDNGSPTQEAR